MKGVVHQVGCEPGKSRFSNAKFGARGKENLVVPVSNAADRSRRMRTDERDEALAARRDSVTARRAVSVECAILKPDW